jgi:hypothetical protein
MFVDASALLTILLESKPSAMRLAMNIAAVRLF